MIDIFLSQRASNAEKFKCHNDRVGVNSDSAIQIQIPAKLKFTIPISWLAIPIPIPDLQFQFQFRSLSNLEVIRNHELL